MRITPGAESMDITYLNGPNGLGAEAWYNDGRHMAYELPLDAVRFWLLV
jgi:hypothetical protein